MTEENFRKKEPIPEFKSREEEAEFWDTHDLADYWDEFTPIEVTFAKNLMVDFTLPLPPETIEQVKAVAQQKGMQPTALVHLWILEKLEEHQQSA